MWWKRKNVMRQQQDDEQLSNSVSSGIKQYVLKKEEKLGGFLNLKINRLSVKSQLLLLFSFCTLFGGMSLYLLMNTFVSTSSSSSAIEPKSINVPQHLNKTGEENIYPDLLVTEEDIRQVQAFKVFMDSLRLSPQGKPIYDSILASRPRLMDTISMLEQLYLIQKNK
jgi:hypothetical protein